MKEFILNYGYKILSFFPILSIIFSCYFVIEKKQKENMIKYFSFGIYGIVSSLAFLPLLRLLKSDNAKVFIFFVSSALTCLFLSLMIRFYMKNKENNK